MRHFVLLCIGLLCLAVQAFPQAGNQTKTIVVSGTVVDQSNEPLIGVNITVKNVPGLGSITDINGKYTIKMEPYNRLIFSYIGYETQEILVKTETSVNVKMKEAESSILDEVVITGTGAQKKISVTGSVTAVDVNALKSNSSSSVVNSLAGNVAGVLARQTSGQPGENTSEFWIRGISTFGASNNALVLVDGFERDMNNINVEDIESFQVLKDASETAIYGSRGANGVVLITTKRGKTGKINIDAKVETTYNTRTITPDYVDGYTYASLLNEARITRNQSPLYTDNELFILKNGLDPDLYPNVDWRDAVLKDGAMSYRASLNLNGGGTNARYFVSASYVDEQGMYKTDETLRNDYNTNANVRRWNYRMNADIDITKTTLLKVGISGMLKKQNDAGKGSGAIWNSLSGYNPIATPVSYSNGYIPAVPDWVSDIRDNPWVAATQTGYQQKWNNQMQTNVTLEQKLNFITKGLRFVGRFGFDTNNTSSIIKFKEPERWTAERYRDNNGNIVFRRLNAEQTMSQTSTGSGDRKEFFEAELHYNRVWGDHHVDGTLKYNQDSKVQTYNLGTDLKNSVPYRHQGLAGRMAYNWKYRYFFNFNFGYTGSENFAADNRFGFFPAISLAWNVAEEKFVKKYMKWINMFKVRYSWGKVGNDATSERFPFIYTIGASTDGYQWADYGANNWYYGKTFTRMGTPAITWEVATKHDVGIDLSLFNDKFTLTADYFHEQREGIFTDRKNLPWTVGILSDASPRANVGGVLSKGVDGNFSYKQMAGGVLLTVHGNFTYSRNEVLDYDETYQDYSYRYNKGYEVNQQRGYIALGLFKDWDEIRNSPTQKFGNGTVEPGDIKYKDVNGDGKITSDDQVPIGATAKPGLIYGIGLSAEWKGLDFNVHFQGAGRSQVMIGGANVRAFSSDSWGNILSDLVKDRWISQEISGNPATENTNASYPRLEYGNGSGNNRQASTFWLRDFSYVRLKTLEVGYTLPKSVINKIHFNKVRIFLLGNNLFTFSGFKTWDPELSDDSSGNRYPISKSITLGLTVNL